MQNYATDFNAEFPRLASPKVLQDRPGVARLPPIGGCTALSSIIENLIGTPATTSETTSGIPTELGKLFLRADAGDSHSWPNTAVREARLFLGNNFSSRDATNGGLHRPSRPAGRFQEAGHERQHNTRNGVLRDNQFLTEENVAVQSLATIAPAKSGGDQPFNFEPRTIEEMMTHPSKNVQCVDDLKELGRVDMQQSGSSKPSSRAEKYF
jgi:hypothetical protein